LTTGSDPFVEKLAGGSVPHPTIEPPIAELRFSFARSGGPGGQNVNKVESKAVLHWDVGASRALPAALLARFRVRCARRIRADGVFQLSSQRHRERERNVADCLAKLAALLAEVATPPKLRRPTRPTRGAKERRLATKRHASRRKAERRGRED
jgi:ribosome-associated protein